MGRKNKELEIILLHNFNARFEQSSVVFILKLLIFEVPDHMDQTSSNNCNGKISCHVNVESLSAALHGNDNAQILR